MAFSIAAQFFLLGCLFPFAQDRIVTSFFPIAAASALLVSALFSEEFMYSFIFMPKRYTLYLNKATKNTNCVVVKSDTESIIHAMKWYTKIKRSMKDKKIIQDDLISVFGVKTRGAVGHYLSGRRTPSAEQFKALAEKFGLTIDELLAEDGVTPQPEKPLGLGLSNRETEQVQADELLSKTQAKTLNDLRQLLAKDIEPMDFVTLQQIIGMLTNKYQDKKD